MLGGSGVLPQEIFYFEHLEITSGTFSDLKFSS